VVNICFFCSAAEVDEKYREPAKQLARMVAQEGHTLVWGGSDRGLMRDIAAAAQEAGGKVLGISMESLRMTAKVDADEMIIARDLAHRKALFMQKSDAIVALVGGTGTLDELTDLFEMRRHRMHDKAIVLLNTDNFYEGLKLQYERMRREGFLHKMPRPMDELIMFADTPEEALDFITQKPETLPKPSLIYSVEAV
jgi:uncharacterized protein (TIGR00730 family)